MSSLCWREAIPKARTMSRRNGALRLSKTTHAVSFVRAGPAARGEPSALVRKDKRFKELGLDEKDYVSRKQVVDVLLAHPELMERPVVIRGDRILDLPLAHVVVRGRPDRDVLHVVLDDLAGHRIDAFLLRLDDPAGPFSPGTTLDTALRRAGTSPGRSRPRQSSRVTSRAGWIRRCCRATAGSQPGTSRAASIPTSSTTPPRRPAMAG